MGMLLLNAENSFFNLKGQSVGISVWGTASILKPLNPDFFISMKNLVACFAGDSKLTANRRHFLAVEKLCNQSETFVHMITLFPRHWGPPICLKCVTYVSGILCNLSVRKLTGPFPIIQALAGSAGVPPALFGFNLLFPFPFGNKSGTDFQKPPAPKSLKPPSAPRLTCACKYLPVLRFECPTEYVNSRSQSSMYELKKEKRVEQNTEQTADLWSIGSIHPGKHE